MAPSFRGRKNLICFYCNKRSNFQYDGIMTMWDCTQCQSTNFLDENGEITDPPVATEFAAPSNLQYNVPRSGPLPSSQEPESELFCAKCLKNQHLFTASLAQYDVDWEAGDRDFRKKEKQYYAFRNRMEKNYPQMCEECEPKVWRRLKEAGMTAKADHLRRLMDKTRARRSKKGWNFSTTGYLDLAGRILWHFGLFGQLIWSVAVLVAFGLHSSPNYLQTLSPSPLLWTERFINFSTSNAWIRSTLFCSIISIWWNPMFSQMSTGFVNHITGFTEWYKLQMLMVISRSLFYFVSGTGVLADAFSRPNIGAHAIMSAFMLLLAHRAKRSLNVDMTPLFSPTPERPKNVAPRSDISPPQSTNSLADILDSIAASPTRGPIDRSPLLPSPPTYNQRPRALQDSPTQNSRVNPMNTRTHPVFLPDMPRTEFARYLATGGQHQPPTQQILPSAIEDEMDWTPAQPVVVESEHRAFQPMASLEGQARGFGQAPVEASSRPFWYKVPAAPITPAQRLRNPPNKPKFTPPSQDIKENFFQTASRGRQGEISSSLNDGIRKHDMILQQPKFFPPTARSEVGNSLSDLLDSFSLDPPPPESGPPVVLKDEFKWDHVGQGIALALGLYFWNLGFSNPVENSNKARLAIMTGCMLIAARTFTSHLFLARGEKSSAATAVGMAFGAAECVSALYGFVEITAGRGECTNCASLGNILLGGMLVQEFWYASFG